MTRNRRQKQNRGTGTAIATAERPTPTPTLQDIVREQAEALAMRILHESDDSWYRGDDARMMGYGYGRQRGLWGMADEQSLILSKSDPGDRATGGQLPWLVTLDDIAMYRAAGRALCWSSEQAICAMAQLINYTLGTGLSYEWHAPKGQQRRQGHDLLQRDMDRWFKRIGWTALEAELFTRGHRDGEIFPVVGESQVGIVEPEWVMPPPDPVAVNERLGQEIDWTWGVGVAEDDEHSDPIGYSVVYPSGRVVVYSAERCRHLKLNVDRRIRRGISDFMPIYPAILSADKIARNTSHGTQVQAAIAYIREHAPGVDLAKASQMLKGALEAELDRQTIDSRPATDSYEYMPSGTVIGVPSGQKYHEAPGAKNSTAFIGVADAMLRYAAQRWQMPEHFLSGASPGVNYATILVKESPFVKSTERRQKLWCEYFSELISQCVPIFASEETLRVIGFEGTGMDLESLSGMAVLAVTATDPQVRNRAEETSRHATLNQAGAMSLATWQEREGLDPSRENTRIEEERAKQQAQQPQGPPGMPGQPGQPGQQQQPEQGQPGQQPQQLQQFAQQNAQQMGQGGGTDQTPPADMNQQRQAKRTESLAKRRAKAIGILLAGGHPVFEEDAEG